MAITPEVFWVDLVLRNPLDTEINLSNVTVSIQASNASSSTQDILEVEIIEDVLLAPNESRTVRVQELQNIFVMLINPCK
jgi:hypothetical protein